MHNKSSVAHWERAWQKRASIPTDHHGSMVNVLVRRFSSLEGKMILEVGAGSAKDSVRLAELGATSYAIDYSGAALGLASKVGSTRGVKLCLAQADTFELPFSDCTFDAVFSQGLLEHFTNPQMALREQSRILKPGGVLLVDVPQKYHLYSLYKWYRMKKGSWFAGWETSFSLRELEEIVLACGMSVIDSYGDGYYPGILLAVRNLHTLGHRHSLPVNLPVWVEDKVEAFWRRAEERRSFYRYLWNIGVLGQKS